MAFVNYNYGLAKDFYHRADLKVPLVLMRSSAPQPFLTQYQ